LECFSDRTGENLPAVRAGAGTRRVKPTEPDKRHPPQGVLWKVGPNGGKIIRKLRQPENFPETAKGENPDRFAIEGKQQCNPHEGQEGAPSAKTSSGSDF